jgi:hypothetical protein
VKQVIGLGVPVEVGSPRRRGNAMTTSEQGPLSVIPAIVWRESSRIAVDARLRIAGMTIDGPKIQHSLA